MRLLKEKIVLIVLFSLCEFTCLFAQGDTSIEVNVINSVIADLYHLGYCERIVQEPYYAIKDYKIVGGKLISDSSSITEEYKVYCRYCINKNELRQLDLQLYVSDSLFDLNLRDHKKYLLDHLTGLKEYKQLVKRWKKMESRPLNPGSLVQNSLIVYTERIDENKKFTVNQGFFDTLKNINIHILPSKSFIPNWNYEAGTYPIGNLYISRIIFNTEKSIGIFKYVFLGRSECGYDAFVMVKKIENKWKIIKIINSGVF
jgi:hypothetical protein